MLHNDDNGIVIVKEDFDGTITRKCDVNSWLSMDSL